MKRLLLGVLTLFLFFNSTSNIFAVNDPTGVPNNKYGIHIFSESDLKDANALVNTSGGDWGYITIVITEGERDHDRWQQIFDQMRHLHLIPIIRLATKADGNIWDAPQEAEINNWVAFLNSLNWVIQNRYVVIGNEPNHAKEWGGRIDPEGYTDYLKEFYTKLKSASPDFFVLPAGLDPAAGNTKESITEVAFLKRMLARDPTVFNSVDGWTSHSYPTASTSSYETELQIIGKKLPVFVTETGWQEDKFSEDQISKNLIDSYTNVWNDPKVVAVTPFILSYTSEPFNIFSWKKQDGTFYKFYYDVQNITKIKGQPTQVESGQILAAFSQPIIVNDIDFVGAILARNSGQTVWKSDNVSIGNETSDFWLKGFSLNDIEPGKLGLIFFRAAEAQKSGIYTNSLFITGSVNQKITNSFSIEAGFTKIDQAEILASLRSILKNWIKI